MIKTKGTSAGTDVFHDTGLGFTLPEDGTYLISLAGTFRCGGLTDYFGDHVIIQLLPADLVESEGATVAWWQDGTKRFPGTYEIICKNRYSKNNASYNSEYRFSIFVSVTVNQAITGRNVRLIAYAPRPAKYGTTPFTVWMGHTAGAFSAPQMGGGSYLKVN